MNICDFRLIAAQYDSVDSIFTRLPLLYVEQLASSICMNCR